MKRDTREAKYALMRILDKEMSSLTGRFLSQEEQLRVLSLGDEIDRLEAEILELEKYDA